MNNYKNRNIHKDAQPAKDEFIEALELLEDNFYNVVRIDRKQLFEVTTKRGGIKFNVRIISATSNTKINSEIAMLMKQYKGKPFYILLTRNPETWPDGSDSYYAKIKSMYNKFRKPFAGVIMGNDTLQNDVVIKLLKDGEYLPLQFEKLLIHPKQKVSIETIFRKNNITGKQLDNTIRDLKLAKYIK